jgi:hypothetical protein
MGCGCKNKTNEQNSTQLSSQQVQSSQVNQTQNNETIKEAIKKTVEKYYRQ